MSKKRKLNDDDDGRRAKRPRTANAPVLSGALGGELKSHAYERCRFFFMYLTTIKRLEYLSNPAQPNARIKAISGLAVKATDQIDDGFREERAVYADFDNDDEDVVMKSTTAFKNIDAAHFCNLGIKPTFAGSLDLTNKLVADLYELLKVVAGNTRWLPQRVNIGPDRRIDILHGKLAEEMLADGKPVCSRQRIKQYVERATASLEEYAKQCARKKKNGVAACARCYTQAYAEGDFIDRIFADQFGALAGWCSATRNQDALDFLIV